MIVDVSYIDGATLLCAVARVRLENAEQEPFSKVRAKTRAWLTCTELRQDLWTRTRTHWCALTEQPYYLFPFSVDYVSHLYAFLRLQSRQRLRRAAKA